MKKKYQEEAEKSRSIERRQRRRRQYMRSNHFYLLRILYIFCVLLSLYTAYQCSGKCL